MIAPPSLTAPDCLDLPLVRCTSDAVVVTFNIVLDMRGDLREQHAPREHVVPIAGVAQLVEHLICNQRVRGSNPFASSSLQTHSGH